MSYVIDRRLNGKNKSTVNRQRFLQRYRGHIKKAVEEAVGRRSITDMEHGEQISIPGRDIDEPVLHHGRGGRHDRGSGESDPDAEWVILPFPLDGKSDLH